MRQSGMTNKANQQVMGHERKMPLKDKISLGPIEKYTLYNRFPYKMTLHIALLILTSLLISVNVQKNQAQLRSQQYVWYKKFMWNQDEEDVPVMDDFNRERRFFTIGEMKEFMTTSLNNYYSMFNSPDEFEDYSSGDYKDGQIIDAKMFVIKINGQDQGD